MRVVNVITTSMLTGAVVEIESFGVFEEQLSSEVSDAAEKYFTKKCEDAGVEEVDIEVGLEDGFCELPNANVVVSISWSTI